MLMSTSCMKRCPHKTCETKMQHTHSGEVFRGMPWYKKQNPKTGQLNPELNRDGKTY